MKITADTFALRVDYRMPGQPHHNEQGETVAPFESKDVAVGETFDVPGKLVRVVEYVPSAAPVVHGSPE